jgi:diacylglycerol kinase family enzyme
VRAVVVVNPNATTVRHASREVLVAAVASAADVTVLTTTHRHHALEIAAQARDDGVGAVIAYGGDGTVNEVVNGVLHAGPGPQVPLVGVVPAGSANVFARNLGLPADPVRATERLLRALARPARSRTIGLGRANGRWFTFNAGLGLDADSVHGVEQARHRGKRATSGLYLRSAVRAYLASDRAVPLVTAELPRGELTPEMFLAFVTNSSPWTYLGRVGVRTAPRSSFDAGLDLVGATSLSIVRLAKHAGEVLLTRRGVRGPDTVHRHDLPRLTLHAAAPVSVQVDGEYLGTTQHLECVAVPRALGVLA